MFKKIITYLFYLLFFLTPLIFTPLNNELFEFNKMIFVYLITIFISGLWILRMVAEKKLIFKSTPLDLALGLFLLSQILSTVTSIDPHTSIWGYYSRSNGGLLSIISYIFLYYGFVSNFEGKEFLKFLKSALLGGFLVALWAIPEHFGHSPSCLFLTGSFNDSCWIQDVQSRVFATLGQPNWLAAYLEMLIFPTIYFFIQSKTRRSKIISLSLMVIFYMAFTFTYSRGATLGLFGGLAVFGIYYLSQLVKKTKNLNLKPFGLVLASILAVNLIFGSALTRFQLFKPSAQPAAGATSQSGVSQIESEGTESSQIRLIVWKGALDIFRHYPIFGSGVETFAFSYYQFRPLEQNSVSEWDFLYNKAHNEFLNYLATTGILGFGTYLLLILSFIVWSIRTILKSKDPDSKLLILAILASYISYLIQNFFQFSVVIIAVFFYLFPAIALSSDENLKDRVFSEKLGKLAKNSTVLGAMVAVVILAVAISSINIGRAWLADTHYASGLSYLDSDNPGKGYNQLIDAANLNPREPLYRSELGFAASSAALTLTDTDATLSAQLKNLAIKDTTLALTTSPKNVSLWRTAIRTYYEVSALDPSYNQTVIDVIDQTIALAPTDPKLYYNKAIILAQQKKTAEALDSYNKTLSLKPDYHDAMVSLAGFYADQNQKDQAISELKTVLKYFPNDPEATAKIQELSK